MARKKPGRKLKLTRPLIEAAERYIRGGNYPKTAAALLGISESSWYSWLARADEIRARAEDAAEAGERIKLSREETLYLAFLESVTRADSEVEARAVLAWQRFFPREVPVVITKRDGTVIQTTELVGDYRAARDFLERRFRKEWSPRSELTGAEGGPIGLQHGGLVIEVVDAREDGPGGDDEGGDQDPEPPG